MSPPTQNRRPLASSNTARVAGGRARSASASCSASAGSRALPASGRSSVIRQTSPSTSVSTRGRSCVLVIVVLPRSACRPPYGAAGGPASGTGGCRLPGGLAAQLGVARARGATELVGDLTGDVLVRRSVAGDARVGTGQRPVGGGQDADADGDGDSSHD